MTLAQVFDPLFRVPLANGFLLALVLPVLGAYVRLRNEWLAALGLAQVTAAGGVMAILVGVHPLAGSLGAAVVAARRSGSMHVMDSINHLFLMTEMIVPGSTYWNYGQGLSPGDVFNDEEGLENMKNLGEQIVWLMERLRKD